MNAPLRRLALVVAVLFTSLLVSTTWIQFVSAEDLKQRRGNTRQLYAELGRDRGPLLVAGAPIASSTPVDDPYRYQRRYSSGPQYATVSGYYSVRYGTGGMERAENGVLTGTSGQLFYRRIGDLLTGRQPQGASVELTVDPVVQQAAYRAMGERRGAVVALEPKTGRVLAMVSAPTYDPNRLATHNSAELTRAWRQLNGDPGRPLDNRAVASRGYPPGSTFKLVTAAAALSSGKYTDASILPGPAVLDLPLTKATLSNDNHRACGAGNKVDFTTALQISCNTAFAQLGMTLGGDAVREQAAKFGFGQNLRVPLAVTPSVVPAKMNAPQTAQAAIGQFDVRVTPLQMAMVSAAIANKGVLMAPNMVRTIRGADQSIVDEPSPEQIGESVTPDVAAQLTRMMLAVVTKGTGRNAAIPGVQVAGKTGTAQHGEGQAPHAWFTAFAPAQDPKVAVAVVIEDGGELGNEASGGRLAAPVARRVIESVLRR